MLWRILCLAGCALGLAFVLALLAPRAQTAHAESVPADGETAPGHVTPRPAVAAPVLHAAADDATLPTLDLPADGTHAVSVAHSTVVTDSALWADPSALSATATRRASEGVAWSAPRPVAREAAPEHPRAPSGPLPGTRAPDGLATMTTPTGSLGAGGGGAPDTGPSITQLAVLSAALIGARWLSQRMRASELSWRNALITLSIERPG